jgi:predicted DNA-binding protein
LIGNPPPPVASSNTPKRFCLLQSYYKRNNSNPEEIKAMAKEIAEQVVNFRLSSDDVARADRLAEKAGLSRSQFLRNLINTGLDEVEVMEKVGLVRAVITLRDVIGWMGDKAKNVSEEMQNETK